MAKTRIEYNCRKKIRNPKEIEKIRQQANDPNTLHGKEAVQALYHMMGMEIDYDDIPL